MKKQAFHLSMNMVTEWRSTYPEFEHICMYQIFDLDAGVCIEKWRSTDSANESKFYLVEIYPYGTGFSIFDLSDMRVPK